MTKMHLVVGFIFLTTPLYARELQSRDESKLNFRPLIGILSQPGGPAPENHSYIAASYVKFVEASGGRAVPIEYDLSRKEVERRFGAVNGVLIPGGGAYLSPHHPFYDTAAQLVALTLDANNKGDYFPLHGTCLGMEVLSIILSKPLNLSLLTGFDSEDYPSKLIFTAEAHSSRFFNSMPSAILTSLQEDNVTMENHHWGLSYESYAHNAGLQDFFTVTSLSLDRQGLSYVSTMEAKQYPITAIQWHPEKNAFEWAAALHIPHTPEAVEVTHAVSNFIVNEARKNHHSPGSKEDENDLLINTYPISFTGKVGQKGIEAAFDECYFFRERGPRIFKLSNAFLL